MSINENEFRSMLESLDYFLEVSTQTCHDNEHGLRGPRPPGILSLREIYEDFGMPRKIGDWGQESGNASTAENLVTTLDELAVADTMFNTDMSEWLYSIDHYQYKTLNESLWFDLNNKLRPIVVRLKIQLERGWGVFLKSQKPAKKVKTANPVKRKRETITDRMIKIAHENPSAKTWTRSKWAKELVCSEEGVRDAQAWKDFAPDRLIRDAAAETIRQPDLTNAQRQSLHIELGRRLREPPD